MFSYLNQLLGAGAGIIPILGVLFFMFGRRPTWRRALVALGSIGLYTAISFS